MVSRLDVSIKIINHIKRLLINFISNYDLFNSFSYYDMPANEVHKLINAIDNNKTDFNSPLTISKELRDLLKIAEPNESIDELKQQMKDESNQLKQQIKEMQELLDNFIKNSNASNSSSSIDNSKIDEIIKETEK